MIFYTPCSWVSRLKVHNSHLVDLSLKRYCDVHTQLPRRLNGHILQDGVWKILPLFWHSISTIESGHKVSRVAGERQETAGATVVALGVLYYLPFSVSGYAAARPGTEGSILQKGL